MVTHISPDASHMTMTKRSSRHAILASCMALALFTSPSLVWAGDSNSHRLINQQRVQDLKSKVADLQEQLKGYKPPKYNRQWVRGSIQDLEARVGELETALAKLDTAKLSAALGAMQSQINEINDSTNDTTLAGKVAKLTTEVTDSNTTTTLAGKVATLAADKTFVSDLKKYVEVKDKDTDMNGVKGPHVVFHGVNVHVQSGSGSTNDGGTLRGLGNLIIGYNEKDLGASVPRDGSHNLVSGRMNSFRSFGGLVFGEHNTISQAARFSAILGGGLNIANGAYSTVYGGQGNTASAEYSFTPAHSTSSGEGGGGGGAGVYY